MARKRVDLSKVPAAQRRSADTPLPSGETVTQKTEQREKLASVTGVSSKRAKDELIRQNKISQGTAATIEAQVAIAKEELKAQQATLESNDQAQSDPSIIASDPQQAASENAEDALSGVGNVLFDPLKPITQAGENAVQASPEGSALRNFNQEALDFAQAQRASVKLFTGFAFRQIGRLTGSTGQMKDQLKMADDIRKNSVTKMNEITALVASGQMSESDGRAAYNKFKQDIATVERGVRRIANDDLKAYLSDAKDNLVEFEDTALLMPTYDAAFEDAVLNARATQLVKASRTRQ